MGRSNHNHVVTCRHCGQRHRSFSFGYRWVHPTTHRVVRRVFIPTRTIHGDVEDGWYRFADREGLIRSQVSEIACARRMGRPAEHC